MNRRGRRLNILKDRKFRAIAAFCLIAQFAGLVLYGSQLWILVFARSQQINWVYYELAEIAAFVALLIGVGSGVVLFRMLGRKTAQLETKLDAASSRFHDVIMEQFDAWGFSKAEAEIGMLLIKGMSIAEIADLRGRSQATIKAQNSSIYQKSGLNNRAQLVSFFVEELTSGF